LTVELLPSSNYEIIGSDLSYIGSLDSDDSSAVDFRIKVKDDSSSIDLPLLLTYKDSINRDYNLKKAVSVHMVSAKDLGIKSNTSRNIAFLVILILVIAYIFYRRQKAKKLALANKAKFR